MPNGWALEGVSMFTQILDIISRRMPGLSLANGLETAREIESLTRQNPASGSVPMGTVSLGIHMIRATAWAERVFSHGDMKNYKIRVVKEIRTNWSLSLAQAKDIAENVCGCSPASYWD